MTDRRRINGPPGGTAPPVFAASVDSSPVLDRPVRTRAPNQPRKIFLKTGLTPSASGSAYLELESPLAHIASTSLVPVTSSLKLTCTVHGPRPLPRSAPYSPQLILSTHIKYAPFASRLRRGYVRDASERDLSAHLETALRGVVIGDRWPKSGLDVVVTVLEGEDDHWWADSYNSPRTDTQGGVGDCGLLNVLAGCITVASAALVDAGIDCVDLISGGVAALVVDSLAPTSVSKSNELVDKTERPVLVLDPCPAEHQRIVAAGVVAYLASRDELTEIWLKGAVGDRFEELLEGAVHAAAATRAVLTDALMEGLAGVEP